MKLELPGNNETMVVWLNQVTYSKFLYSEQSKILLSLRADIYYVFTSQRLEAIINEL